MANWNTCSGKDSYSKKGKLNDEKLPPGVSLLFLEQEIRVMATQFQHKFEQKLEVLKLAKLVPTVE